MTNILNLGLNFIPSYYFNSYHVISSLLKSLEQEFSLLNRKLFILQTNTKDNIQSVDKATINQVNIDIPSQSISTNLIDHFRSKSNPHSYPYHSLSLDLKYKLLKHISNCYFNINLNIKKDDLNFLKKFSIEKPFEIVQCDKNVGCAIISHRLHDNLALEHLSDVSTYLALQINPLEKTIILINNTLKTLYKNKNIDIKLYKKLIISKNECSLGKFRILPKLHKDKFGIRPIINSTNHPTSKFCKIIELLLGPHVKNLPSYIQDSQNLIQDSYQLKIPRNSKLISADIESLYTNIRFDHAITTVSNFAKDKIYNSGLDLIAFIEILKLVLQNNIFSFKTNDYLQVKGIAMGCICGPTIANIVVHSLESDFLQKFKPHYYKRYIDDIFMIIDNNFNLNNFLNNFGYLKLSISHGLRVNFLDLDISLNELSQRLEFSLYIKPTNTFSYLRTDSNHPDFIFENNPKSLFIRIRRICTYYNDFLYHSTLLITRLLKRGYDYNKLIKIRHMVCKLDRDSLIPYKQKINKFSADTVFFKIPYDFNIFKYSNLLLKNFFKENKFIINDKEIKIQLIHSTQPNLGSILVHKFKLPKQKKKYLKIKNVINPPVNYVNLLTYNQAFI
jgi:hypothetical protein